MLLNMNHIKNERFSSINKIGLDDSADWEMELKVRVLVERIKWDISHFIC